MTRTVIIFILLIYLTKTSSYAQLVPENFAENIFSDNFESDKGIWKIMSNADNLFLIQDGKYLLQRKHTKSAYSVFPKWENPASSYEITINIILESTEGPESGAGLIFMAQADGSGAFVFEINANKQYRLKQLVGVNYRLLTGTLKSNGWMDSPILNGANQTNLIQVKISNRNYDIYINQNYIISFTELAYKTGNIGISAGPSSKFMIDQISVYSNSNTTKNDELNKPGSTNAGSDSAMILMYELQMLKKENKILRDSLKYFKEEKSKSKIKDVKTGQNLIDPVKHPE